MSGAGGRVDTQPKTRGFRTVPPESENSRHVRDQMARQHSRPISEGASPGRSCGHPTRTAVSFHPAPCPPHTQSAGSQEAPEERLADPTDPARAQHRMRFRETALPAPLPAAAVPGCLPGWRPIAALDRNTWEMWCCVLFPDPRRPQMNSRRRRALMASTPPSWVSQ